MTATEASLCQKVTERCSEGNKPSRDVKESSGDDLGKIEPPQSAEIEPSPP